MEISQPSMLAGKVALDPCEKPFNYDIEWYKIVGLYNEIIAFLNKKNSETQLVLIRNFRAPIGTRCIEFPAGLIEKTQVESVEIAAIRELKEETGYTGKVLSVLPSNGPIVLGPAVSNTTSLIVIIEINGDSEENQNPVKHLEGDEFIDVITVPLSKLWESINEWQKEGTPIEGRVYTFCLSKYLFNTQGESFIF